MKRDDMKAVLSTVGRYIRRAFEPRIKAVEDRVGELPALVEKAIAAIPTPKDGVSVTAADVAPMIKEMVDALPAARNGKDADPAEVERMVREAVAAIPAPKDGTSVTTEDVAPLLQRMVDALPPPRDPEPVTVDLSLVAAEAVKELLVSPGLRGICNLAAAEAVGALPPAPKGDAGKSVTVEEVVSALLPTLEIRFEALVAKHMLDLERRAQGVLERAVERIPKPKDGERGLDGKDGRDAFALEDFEADLDGDGRTVMLKFVRGDQVHKHYLSFPVPIDRGVWEEKRAKAYQRGDGVTWGGSWFVAQKDFPDGKPGESDDWRMAVRRGREGKQGPKGDRGEFKVVKS